MYSNIGCKYLQHKELLTISEDAFALTHCKCFACNPIPKMIYTNFYTVRQKEWTLKKLIVNRKWSAVAVQRTSARSGLKHGRVTFMPLICSKYICTIVCYKTFETCIFRFKKPFRKGILRFCRSKKSKFEHFVHPTSKQGRVQTAVPPLNHDHFHS